MSSVWSMIFQSGSTIKAIVDLPPAARHRRDMTEKLLKVMLNQSTHPYTHILMDCKWIKKVKYFIKLFFILAYGKIQGSMFSQWWFMIDVKLTPNAQMSYDRNQRLHFYITFCLLTARKQMSLEEIRPKEGHSYRLCWCWEWFWEETPGGSSHSGTSISCYWRQSPVIPDVCRR